jgi:hypothetical protein
MHLNLQKMARPITETPVLTGNDAVKFIERAKNPTKATAQERQAIKDAYNKFKLMSKDLAIF